MQKRWLPALGSGGEDPNKAIIALHNLIVHSARLPSEQAQQLLDSHRQPFEALVKELAFLSNYALVACTKEGKLVWLKGLPAANGSFPSFDQPFPFEAKPERVYLVKGDNVLDIFPFHAFTDIFQWREERFEFEAIAESAPRVYFRLSDKGYLEFVPFSEEAAFSHLRGSAYKRFQEIFRLEEWRERRRREAEAKGQMVLFDQIVSELTEVFVGRDEHLEQVKKRIRGTRHGVLWISEKNRAWANRL